LRDNTGTLHLELIALESLARPSAGSQSNENSSKRYFPQKLKIHTEKFITNKSEGQERSRKGRNRKSIEGERKVTGKKQGKGKIIAKKK
jgi:hypothetical protein